MSELISNWAFTPELLRNGRSQLRRGRILAVVVICAALSFSAVAYFFYSPAATGSGRASFDLFRTMMIVQIALLLIGGGIYCLQSVHREKELNTFDYQRVTRLRPIELTIGKLLGAPALIYFVALCLTPITLIAAFLAEIPISRLLQIYWILLLGSVTYHLLTLLLSLMAPKGSMAGTMLFFLFLVSMSSIDFTSGMSTFALHGLSPFFILDLIGASGTSEVARNPFATLPPLRDSFLGMSVPHVLVLTVLYVTFSAFFLLALTRNIKRDPSVYEIYSPWQGLAFVLYLNALVLAFFRWQLPFFTSGVARPGAPFVPTVGFRPITAGAAETTFLGIGLWLFGILGLALLRNRERIRRRIRQYGARASGWWAAIWPSPYLLAGAIITGAAILGMIRYNVEEYGDWSFNVGMLEIAFLALWLARDFQYLQWMNVRKGRRPLVAGILYLIIFYVCASAFMAAFGLYRQNDAPYRAIFVPSAALGLDMDSWASAERLWMGALLLLVLQTLGFVWLQRRELGKLASPSGQN